jgi:hypothetical protein
LAEGQLKFSSLHDQCEVVIDDICVINEKFKSAFNRDIPETKFDGEFKRSYRKSTIYIYNVLANIIKARTEKGNKVAYIFALVVITHAFNNIFSDTENLRKILREYLEEKKQGAEKLNFSELREWMSKSSQRTLNNIVSAIVRIYFQT